MPATAERPRPEGRCCGRHVFVVCTGEECRRQGSEHLLHVLEEACAHSAVDVRVAASQCLGHCGLAPAMIEDGEILGSVSGRRLRVELTRLGLAGQ